MTLINRLFTGRHASLGGIALLALILIVVMPMALDLYRLNLAGRYLTYAFVALGLVLCWGYGGILSLGQGIFFGVGGYAMAMFLKLEASDPESTSIQTTPGIPDFMDWNRITELPWFWVPFESLTFTILAVLTLPAAFAFVIGYAMFKRRVSGVYFAIITQALAVVLTILIVGQQGYTGGINGITDLRTLKGWDIRDDSSQYLLYYLNAVLLIGCVLIGRWVLSSKYGRILTALRDREDRVRFSGYDVANFKIFIFCLAAFMSGIGGAMFTLQVGFMSPSFVGIVPSIEFVIFAAVGGRLSLLGGVYGALLVSYAKTLFAEAYPQLWQVMIGTVFILVVLILPYGLASVVDRYWPLLRSRLPLARRSSASSSSTTESRP
ncbi:urea ABC transporter permease subunit UrtC [Vreelandella olivaria]|uniref:urea ABC transporter permease subunit UrtC n=1 Tax=Vreelandella olivaria TaxID=390919 RepID=UPI00201E7D47|nr:urea ABC transporter permease subunit UrtC [Halomonas olivaria]